jgi:hypothetical protein
MVKMGTGRRRQEETKDKRRTNQLMIIKRSLLWELWSGFCVDQACHLAIESEQSRKGAGDSILRDEPSHVTSPSFEFSSPLVPKKEITMSTPTALHNVIRQPAVVDLCDESHGVFGELLEPNPIVEVLQNYEERVGQIDDPSAASAMTALHSLYCTETGDSNGIIVEFENATRLPIKVRWMDEKGHNASFLTVEPFSTVVQWARPGYLYLLTVFVNPNEELLLGAYRTLMPLPSGSPHCLLILEGQQHVQSASVSTAGAGTVNQYLPAFKLENVLNDDDTHTDALHVAAAGLDPARGSQSSHPLPKTLQTLSTLVKNILDHPDDVKYQTLRLSNAKVNHHLVECPSAMYMLHALGFRQEDDDHLIAPQPDRNVFRKALDLLELLLVRSASDFVAELAPRPGWQHPPLSSQVSQAQWSAGTHFITPEERWARIERWSSTRGRHGRRPDPGNAPSSRGTWGR